MEGLRAQISVELAVIASIMVGLLLAIYIASGNLRIMWDEQRQSMEAGQVAFRVAFAINRAAAGGNGTTVKFFNSAPAGVENVTLYNGRTVRAYTLSGAYSSAGLVTNRTQASGAIPINQEIVCRNSNGTIIIEAA